MASAHYTRPYRLITGLFLPRKLTYAVKRRTTSAYIARMLWLTFAWILTISYFGFGLAYVTPYGAPTFSSPAYAFVREQAGPHAQVIHGTALLAIAGMLLAGLAPVMFRRIERKEWLHMVALPFAAFYALVVTVAFGCAPLAPGGRRSTGPIAWGILMAMSVALIVLNEPARFKAAESVRLKSSRTGATNDRHDRP